MSRPGPAHLDLRVAAPRGRFDVALKRVADALAAGLDDIKQAYAFGTQGDGPGAAVAKLYDAQQRLFNPERFIPRVTDEDAADTDNPPLRWKLGTVKELLADKRVRAAVALFLKDKSNDLKAVKGELDPAQGRALDSLMAEMMGDPATVLTAVIDWTPQAGGGIVGSSTETQARDYVDEATRTAGGLASLTVTQRARLLGDMTPPSDAPVGSQSSVAHGWRLLETAPREDVAQIIRDVGWSRLARFLGAQVFAARFPRETYDDGPATPPVPRRPPGPRSAAAPRAGGDQVEAVDA